MGRPVPLDNIDHHDLRVAPRTGAAFGDTVNQMLVLPTEFEEAHREFPIFLRRDDAGAWQSVALLGLDRGENLFLDAGEWTTRHIPVVQQRGPFSIAASGAAGDDSAEPLLLIDLDDPRVNRDDGHPLFLPHGGNAPYLRHVQRILQVIRQGLHVSAAMFAAWEAAGLIEPVAVEIRVSDMREYALANYHTISAARLADCPGDVLERLNRAGFLRLAFLVQSSLANVDRLIALKRARDADG